jgi:IS5 family transposase
VEQITRVVIEKATRETRFRPRAARIDSTVIEADIRYPSDAMLALAGSRALVRQGRKLSMMVKGKTVRLRDRSRSIGRTVRAISKTLARRTGEAKEQVMVTIQVVAQRFLVQWRYAAMRCEVFASALMVTSSKAMS